MDIYESLITFLEDKAKRLNNVHQEINEAIEQNLDESTLAMGNLDSQLVKHVMIQLRVMDITKNILELSAIKAFNPKSHEEEIRIYLKKEIKQILRKKKQFNKTHFLYGFGYFHEKLKEAYAKAEHYEKCQEIINLENM